MSGKNGKGSENGSFPQSEGSGNRGCPEGKAA